MLVLAAEPVLLLLDRGYTRFVLAASGGLWLAWQIAPDQAVVWPPSREALFQHETSYWKTAALQMIGVILVWAVIRVRPFLAVSLEGLDSIWQAPQPTSAETTHSTAPGVVSIDVAIAQAQAGRDSQFLR